MFSLSMPHPLFAVSGGDMRFLGNIYVFYCEETSNQAKHIFILCQVILTQYAITKSYSPLLRRLIH